MGLPITLELPEPAPLQSYSISDLNTAEKLEACGFDAQSFRGLAVGNQMLSGYKAVVVIPRRPFEPGHRYGVSVEAGGTYDWTFSVRRTL